MGEPSDPSAIEWVPFPEVSRLLREGHVTDGMSLSGQLWWVAFESGDR